MRKGIFILLASLPFCADAANTCDDDLGNNCWDCSKTDSDSCTARLKDGVLTFSGNGKMKNYAFSYSSENNLPTSNPSPWYNQSEPVKKIIIEEGITSVGSHAFADMPAIKEVELPEGLEIIGRECFRGTGITSLDLPSTLTTIGNYAFNISTLEKINAIPELINIINDHTFSGTKIKNWIIPQNVTYVSPYTFKSSAIENLYCEEGIVKQCEKAVQWKKDLGQTVNVLSYQKQANGNIFYKNHWYSSPNNILSADGYIKKRIYTIDEANFVAGEVNSFKIKYR